MYGNEQKGICGGAMVIDRRFSPKIALGTAKGQVMVDQMAYSDGSAPEQTEFAKSDFLARMSHEMRTPLSAILGYAQLMASGGQAPTAAQSRSLNLILQAGWYLEKLIDTTRDLALIEAGSLDLSLERWSLAAIMRDCEATIEPQARARGIRVIFPVFETPCFVLADAARMQQVLGNLLSAAIERSAVGGAVVVDYAVGSSDWVRISISDAIAQQAAVLQDKGICVLLAQRLVELMGGAFGADADAAPGRVSWFALKRLQVPAAATHGATHSHIAFNASDTSAANAIPR